VAERRLGVPYSGTRVRVGTDVESIDEVADAVRRFGTRYLSRVYTDHEVASAGGTGPDASPGLTARFAAKEATLKVLRPGGARIPTWRSIEVHRHPDGWCEIRLTDEAAALARQAGLGELAVSLSHGAGVGMATVVGLCTADGEGS
jgi:holo-[acyl-carrier protein] synthase